MNETRDELSQVELEIEMCTALPGRWLLSHRRHHHRGGTSAHAAFGSVANANHTHQSISGHQTAVVLGGAAIGQTSVNTNNNSNLQFGVPING